MTVAELIARLQELADDFGDHLPVVVDALQGVLPVTQAYLHDPAETHDEEGMRYMIALAVRQ